MFHIHFLIFRGLVSHSAVWSDWWAAAANGYVSLPLHQSLADRCKKIHAGDEVIQVNHQTVVRISILFDLITNSVRWLIIFLCAEWVGHIILMPLLYIYKRGLLLVGYLWPTCISAAGSLWRCNILTEWDRDITGAIGGSTLFKSCCRSASSTVQSLALQEMSI